MFGGFGPIVAGIVFAILDATLEDFHIDGWQILLAVVSTYLLTFVHAGASVFNQIEHWSIAKSLGLHFVTLYLAYSITYIANSWIAFEPMVLVIFTAIFAVTYFIIWFAVYFIVRATEKKLNKSLRKLS
jgi:hypothetical protein